MPNKYNILNEIGFSGTDDLVSAVLGLKNNLTFIATIGVALGSIFSIIQNFINAYVYTPANGVFILFAATIFDIVLGLYKAVYFKEGIDPKKISRALIRFVIQIILVGIFTNMHLVFSHFIYSWMVDTVLIIFTLSTVWSLIRNAHKVELITDDQYSTLENLVSVKNILSKFSKNKK